MESQEKIEIKKLKADCLELEKQVRLLVATELKLRRTQAELIQSKEQIEESNRTLEQKVEERTKELKISEKRFKDIVFSTADWIWEVDENGKFTYCSENVIDILGYTKEEIIGKSFFELSPSDDEGKLNQIAQILIKGKKPVKDFENWTQTKNGIPICLLTDGVPIVDDHANLKGFRGINKDITFRKQAGVYIKTSELQYRRLFESAKDGILILDFETGLINDVNPSLSDILHSSKENITGKKFWEIIDFKDFEEASLVFKKLQQDKYIKFDNLLLKIKTEQYIDVEFISNVYLVDKQRVIQCNFRDISERKRAEQILNTLNKAVIAMSTELTPEDIFIAVSQELKKIGFLSVICEIDESQNQLYIKYVSYESGVKGNFKKLVDIDFDKIPIDIDNIEEFRKTVREKKTIFIEDSLYMLQLIIPENIRKFAPKVSKILDGQKVIQAPLIVHDKVVGVFSVQSKYLTEKDIPAITAFALQISASMYKADLIQNLNKNLSELKRAEDTVQRERILLRTLIDNLPDTIYVKDIKGRKLVSNTADLNAMNYSSEKDIIGKTDLEIFNDERGLRGYEEDLSVMQTGRPMINHEDCYLDAKGLLNWRLNTKIPLYNEQKEVIGLVGIGHDITERKKTEGELKNSEQKYRELTNMLPTGIFETDINGYLTFVNQTAYEWFGYSEDEISPEINVLQFIVEKDFQRGRENLRNIYPSKPISSEEYEVRRKNGSTFPALITSRVILKDGQMIGLRGIINDISEHKHAEKLHYEKEAAEAANRAKSEFLSQMSHEIRTPMNAIIGFSELLASSIEDEDHRSQIEIILRSSNNLLKIINDILDLSKIEAGELIIESAPVHIHTLFEEVKSMFLNKVKEKGVPLILETGNGLPAYLILDEMRIRQVLVNLIGNAFKFTSRGHIRLLLDKKIKSKAADKIDLVFSVEDTGIGIPAEQQELIFEPFKQQLDQSTKMYGGTGLGLTITKKLVELMGGKITVTSTPGQGSTFTIFLPDIEFTDQEIFNSGNKAFDPKSILFEKCKILICDDIENNRKLLIDVLKNSPFEFYEAEDGKSAINNVMRFHPDLILMDILMPELNGFEVARIIKNNEFTKSIPIIAISASIPKKEEQDSYNSVFCDYLLKPVNLFDLFEAMKKHLKHRSV